MPISRFRIKYPGKDRRYRQEVFRNDSISDLTVEIKAVFLEKCSRAGANIKISDKLS